MVIVNIPTTKKANAGIKGVLVQVVSISVSRAMKAIIGGEAIERALLRL